MKHYYQWSAAFASYFTIWGLWIAFGPDALMAISPQVASISLAAISLVFFAAMPISGWLQARLGFALALQLLGGGVLLSLALAAIAPDLLAWSMPFAFFFGMGASTLCEMQLIELLTRSRQGHEFSRARKWGSFGYVVSAALGGAAFSLISGAQALSMAMALCSAAFFVCCLWLARACRSTATAGALPPAQADGMQSGGSVAPVKEGGLHRYFGAGAISTLRLAETATTTWFGAYWLATGHSAFETGLLCALPVVAEFVAMWKGVAFMARFSAVSVLLVCSAVSVARWLATPFCTGLWCAIPLQSLHALSFGVFFPTSLLWLRSEFGQSFFRTRYMVEASARALAALISYVAAAWAIRRLGYVSVFGLSAALALLATLWWVYVWHSGRGKAAS